MLEVIHIRYQAFRGEYSAYPAPYQSAKWTHQKSKSCRRVPANAYQPIPFLCMKMWGFTNIQSLTLTLLKICHICLVKPNDATFILICHLCPRIACRDCVQVATPPEEDEIFLCVVCHHELFGRGAYHVGLSYNFDFFGEDWTFRPSTHDLQSWHAILNFWSHLIPIYLSLSTENLKEHLFLRYQFNQSSFSILYSKRSPWKDQLLILSLKLFAGTTHRPRQPFDILQSNSIFNRKIWRNIRR